MELSSVKFYKENAINNIVIIANDPLVATALLRVASFWGRKCVVLSRYGCSYLRFAAACETFYEVEEEIIQHQLMRSISDLALDKTDNLFIAAGDISTRALIITASENPLKTFPLPSLSSFDNLYRKDKFSELCNLLNLPIPLTAVVEDRYGLTSFLCANAEISFPLIVKPIAMSGGIGIRVAKTPKQLQAIIDDTDYNYHPLVVQQYIDGEDIGVSLLCRAGQVHVAYVQQRTSGGDRFPHGADLVGLAKKIVTNASYTGPAHIDARIDASGKLYLIEFNARFWASVELSTYIGIDLLSMPTDLHQNIVCQGLTRDSGATFSLSHAISTIFWPSKLSRCEANRFLRLIIRDPIGSIIKKSELFRRVVCLKMRPPKYDTNLKS